MGAPLPRCRHFELILAGEAAAISLIRLSCLKAAESVELSPPCVFYLSELMFEALSFIIHRD